MTVLHTAIKRKKSCVMPACGCIRNLVSLPSIKNWMSAAETNRSFKVGLTGIIGLPVGVAACKPLVGKWFKEARLEPLNLGCMVMGLCAKSWPPMVHLLKTMLFSVNVPVLSQNTY